MEKSQDNETLYRRTSNHVMGKVTKHFEGKILTYNYECTLYIQLQNLRQGLQTIDNYAEDFSLLLTRTDIYDSEKQLVSGFNGGLRIQLQNASSQFNPTTLAKAHQKATTFEHKQKTSNGEINHLDLALQSKLPCIQQQKNLKQRLHQLVIQNWKMKIICDAQLAFLP